MKRPIVKRGTAASSSGPRPSSSRSDSRPRSGATPPRGRSASPAKPSAAEARKAYAAQLRSATPTRKPANKADLAEGKPPGGKGGSAKSALPRGGASPRTPPPDVSSRATSSTRSRSATPKVSAAPGRSSTPKTAAASARSASSSRSGTPKKAAASGAPRSTAPKASSAAAPRAAVPRQAPSRSATPKAAGATPRSSATPKRAGGLPAAQTKKPAGPGASAPSAGATASGDLARFTGVFQPLAEKTPAGEALRKAGWRAADANGNGLASLAELETFVLKTLVAKFPKVGRGKDVKEPGRDLFDAFRPCFIRAYNDAKDFQADSGAVIKGTKKSTADDYVSKGEFRLFCAYLCIYGTMFDAFAKIDGGGAGRDAKDDRRVDRAEWLKGYRSVSEHGFVALAGVADDAAAEALFAKMDSDGAGMVLLGVFCDFLKASAARLLAPPAHGPTFLLRARACACAS